MPVFIELTTDAFEENFRKRQLPPSGAGRSRRAGATRARRPMRGLEIKEDTYAILKVVAADGTPIELYDSGSPTGRTAEYTNFILQSVAEARMEKHQIIDTFGEPYIYFFGEHPRFLDVQSVLVTSHDFNWEAEFWANYEEYLRGTKLVEMGARAYLFYDDVVVEGYMLQAQAVKTSDNPLTVSLTFRLFLTNYQNISFIGVPQYPVRASVNLPPSVDLTTADPFDVATAAQEAAVKAAGDEVFDMQAAQGIALQKAGFGGGKTVTDVLRSGIVANSDTSGILQNAVNAINNFSGDLPEEAFRRAPVRALISDNFDEYTTLLPAKRTYEEDHDGPIEVTDVPTGLTAALAPFGASIGDASKQASLGLIPALTGTGESTYTPMANGQGFSYTSTYGYGFAAASYGQSTTQGVNMNSATGFSQGSFATALATGMQSGVSARAGAAAGFTSRAYAGASVQGGFTRGASSGAYARGAALTTSASGTAFYTGGVRTGGGIAGGVGIGGGVNGGLSLASGLSAGVRGALSGAATAQGQPSLGASYRGAGLGASTVVTGKCTCFSLVSVPGLWLPKVETTSASYTKRDAQGNVVFGSGSAGVCVR